MNKSRFAVLHIQNKNRNGIANAPPKQTKHTTSMRNCWKVRIGTRRTGAQHTKCKIPLGHRSRCVNLAVCVQFWVSKGCLPQKLLYNQLADSFDVMTTTVVAIIYVGFSHFPSKSSWEQNRAFHFICVHIHLIWWQCPGVAKLLWIRSLRTFSLFGALPSAQRVDSQPNGIISVFSWSAINNSVCI